MNQSDLIKELFNRSKFTNPSGLAKYTNQTQPFVNAWLNGKKESRKKEDILFEALFEEYGITVEELFAAIDLIKLVKEKQIEREQIL